MQMDFWLTGDPRTQPPPVVVYSNSRLSPIQSRAIVQEMIEPKQVLEQKHMAELKEAFQYIDHDGDGLVDEQDLMELLPALGKTCQP